MKGGHLKQFRTRTTIILFVYLLIWLPVQAQQQQWTQHLPNPDPMLSTKNDKCMYTWTDDDCNVAILSCKKGQTSPETVDKLYIQTPDGIFLMNGFYTAKVRIGVYTGDGMLREQWTVNAHGDTECDMLLMSVNKKLRRYLLDRRYHIRIVANQYVGGPFDVIVPCLANYKLPESPIL